MFEIDKELSSKEIVQKIYNYTVSKGLVVKRNCIDTDSSPYFVLEDDTSISYRKTSRKWNQKGIVFFCSKDGRIKDILVTKYSLSVLDNSSDMLRPYAVFIPTEMFESIINDMKEFY